jgi:hypothetical protein
MSFLLKIGIVVILMGSCLPVLLLAQSESNKILDLGTSGGLDSIASFVFDSERDLELFISEYAGLFDEQSTIIQLDSIRLDSLFLALNRDKRVMIPKAHLPGFVDFVLDEPAVKTIMAQGLDLSPKTKQVTYSFDVNEGDHFFLKFASSKGGGQGARIEVLFNAVRVSDELVLNRKKEFEVDFVVARAGKVEVVFKNFGLFRVQGDLRVDVQPRKERIRYLEARQLQLFKKEVNVTVKDTIYQTLFDEAIRVTHKLNLKGNAVFEKPLEFLPDRNVLGFAIFLYPFGQKEKLEYQRREVYREDPLQDFALKELTGRSYTYLPVFDLTDLDFSVVDFSQKKKWLNGEIEASDSWQSSPNSKRNYAFFKAQENLQTSTIYVKVSNRSALYNRELGLQIIALIEESFIVSESVEVAESLEIIILTLL